MTTQQSKTTRAARPKFPKDYPALPVPQTVQVHRWPIPVRDGATALGVSPTQLAEVLSGQRVSASLLTRYRALCASRGLAC